MSCQILRTDKTDIQVRNLINYIVQDSGSVDIALVCLDKIEHAINLLKDQPYYGIQARHPLLRKMQFRVVVTDHYLVFYKVRERDATVIIYAVVDSRQDYVDLVL